MKLFNYKELFEIETDFDSEEIKDTLKKFVEFDHKRKISTFQIKKEYYGDIVSTNIIKIWKRPSISGFMDKELTSTIEVKIEKNKVLIKVQDYLFTILLFLCAIVFIISGLLIIEGIKNVYFRELIWFGILVSTFPVIAFLIERRTFFKTVKNVKRIFDNLKNQH